MSETDIRIAKQLKKRLSKIVDMADLRVFGSRAKGTADEQSDMDVFVEVESLSRDQKEKIKDIAWEISLEHLIVITPLIFTREEIEKSPLRSSPIVKNIMAEGIRV